MGLLPACTLDALFPEMAHLSSSREGLQSLRHLFPSGLRMMLAGGMALAAAGALIARCLIPLVYGRGEEYAPAVVPFQLLVCASPAMFLYLLSGHTLCAKKRQRSVTKAMLVVGLANVALNLVVIPR